MPSPQFNRAAGFRRLGARKAARQISHQVEAGAHVSSADRLLGEMVTIIRNLHEHLKNAERELVEANRIACEAEYVEPDAQREMDQAVAS